MREVTVIDYGMGNLRSVRNAFEALGADVNVSEDPKVAFAAERIVLPGVGAFGDGMDNLRRRGWIDFLEREVRENGRPFLGLCLGMQLLATTGTEHGTHAGLGWVTGTVERIESDKVRVPHVGWNDVEFTKENGLYAGLSSPEAFYFVHSYTFCPQDPDVVSGVCHHGGEFAASVEFDNIFATQYHPEKSHKIGLAVLQNFLSVPSW